MNRIMKWAKKQGVTLYMGRDYHDCVRSLGVYVASLGDTITSTYSHKGKELEVVGVFRHCIMTRCGVYIKHGNYKKAKNAEATKMQIPFVVMQEELKIQKMELEALRPLSSLERYKSRYDFLSDNVFRLSRAINNALADLTIEVPTGLYSPVVSGDYPEKVVECLKHIQKRV